MAADDLVQRLDAALGQQRWAEARSLREELARTEQPGAAHAGYLVGLEILFREKDMPRAAEALRQAVRLKQEPWSAMARVSLGTLLLRMGKAQQGMFELRKAASNPTLLGAQAQALLADALSGSRKGEEADKVRTEMQDRLQKLTASQDPAESAYAHLMLGMELKLDGRRADAKRHLEAALAAGALPEAETETAQAALKEV